MYFFPFIFLAIAVHAESDDHDEHKAIFAHGNASLPLNPRGLFERQYTTCESGYGQCDAGQCCPLDGGCCASYCREAGEGCCGDQRYSYPLDGSECCSDGSHCDPGYSCYECQYSSSSVCCCKPEAVASYSAGVQQASAAVESYNAAASQAVESYDAEASAAISSYDSAVSSVNAHNSAAYTSYTAAVSEYNEENSEAYASYTAALSSYYASGGAYEQYEYWYTTYRYYIIIWYTTKIATPELTSSSSSTSTILSAYCTDSAEAQVSWTSLAQSVDAEVGYSEIASKISLSIPNATASYSYTAGGGGGSGGRSNGAGSMAVARSSVMIFALPALGLMMGVLAVLL